MIGLGASTSIGYTYHRVLVIGCRSHCFTQVHLFYGERLLSLPCVINNLCAGRWQTIAGLFSFMNLCFTKSVLNIV